MVKSLRRQCIELLTEIDARLDFEDEMPPLDVELVVNKINSMSQDVEQALETANYDKLLQSGLQVEFSVIPRFASLIEKQLCCTFDLFHTESFAVCVFLFLICGSFQ